MKKINRKKKKHRRNDDFNKLEALHVPFYKRMLKDLTSIYSMKYVRQKILIYVPFILGMILSYLLGLLIGHLKDKFDLIYPGWIGMIIVLIGLIPLIVGACITGDKLNNAKK